MLVSIGLMIYYNNLPGYGFMPGLSYLGEVLFSFGAAVFFDHEIVDDEFLPLWGVLAHVIFEEFLHLVGFVFISPEARRYGSSVTCTRIAFS